MTGSEGHGSERGAILVVDDEAIVRESLQAWFKNDGYDVDATSNGQDALRLVAEKEYSIALLDIKMPKMDGLELQRRLGEACPDLTVIVMTAYASVESAVQALKNGAYDYIVKPFDPDELSHLVRRAQEHRSLQSENIRLKRVLEVSSGDGDIIGESPAARRIQELISTVAATDSTVLIQGESGTGKELVARAIHKRSARRYNALIMVHCGALAEGVLESELFGHEKGAFTGAQHSHKGKFEQADGGTIFLDEIGDITPRVQVELLRVLEEKKVTRVGGSRTIPVDFRTVAATNRDLKEMVKAGEFREDLFWRLNVVTIEIPPLRDRKGDIPLLVHHFLERLCRSMNRKPVTVSDEAMQVLEAYSWPGNVRELQNAIERAVVLGPTSTLEASDLPSSLGQQPSYPRARSLADVEIHHIQSVLEECDWNISQASRILNVDRGTLYNKIRKYRLAKSDHVG